MKYLSIILGLVLIISCEQQLPAKIEHAVSQGKVIELESRLESIEAKIYSLELDMMLLKDKYAVLNTESETYDLMRNDFGIFPVVCKSVKPYLDGYEIKIDVGNPTSMNFQGAKVKCRWWKMREEKSKEFEFTTTFPPARYTPLKLTVTPLTVEEARKMQVLVEFNRISLYQR